MSVPLEIVISPELEEKIRGHGAETYPHECCGALLGRELTPQPNAGSQSEAPTDSREVQDLLPVTNRRDDSPRNRFSVSAEDVLLADKTARERSLDVIGWYHSHPDHPARPSDYDREHAWPWYSYVIVSVQRGTPGEMTSWRLNDSRSEFLQESIAIVNVSAAD
jgi:proteasome lid subunit RPN8/RPN11